MKKKRYYLDQITIEQTKNIVDDALVFLMLFYWFLFSLFFIVNFTHIMILFMDNISFQ